MGSLSLKPETGKKPHTSALQTVCVLAMLVQSGYVWAQQITVYYNPRPPYLVFQENKLTGLTGSPAITAFDAARISYKVVELPASRQLLSLQQNQTQECAIGWFKNPEREVFAKFTKPIYQDEAQIALVSADNTRLDVKKDITSVLSNPTLELLVKQSYSYGKELDALIEKYHPQKQIVTSENVQMFKMIATGRADYMFAAPEEALVTISNAGYAASNFKLLKLSGAPKGELRYIMCSKNVPDEIIGRLNEAIKPLKH
jgi:polar amino acid transport system substrate-binding protein